MGGEFWQKWQVFCLAFYEWFLEVFKTKNFVRKIFCHFQKIQNLWVFQVRSLAVPMRALRKKQKVPRRYCSKYIIFFWNTPLILYIFMLTKLFKAVFNILDYCTGKWITVVVLLLLLKFCKPNGRQTASSNILKACREKI